MEVVLHVLFACIVTYINVKKRIILCSNVYEPLSHLRDGGGCTLVGRNTLLKKKNLSVCSMLQAEGFLLGQLHLEHIRSVLQTEGFPSADGVHNIFLFGD